MAVKCSGSWRWRCVGGVALSVLSGACESQGEFAGGAEQCRSTARVEELDAAADSPLGASAQAISSPYLVSEKPIVFEWWHYDTSAVMASISPEGGMVPGLFSLQQSTSKSRWIGATHQSCQSWLEVDLSVSLTTQDSALNETLPITLAFDDTANGTGSITIPASDLRGSLTVVAARGELVGLDLSLIVQDRKLYGGLRAVVSDSTGTSLSSVLLGRWSP
jgi:hypothetical protein